MNITPTKEDYIRAIFVLHESRKQVGITSIADKLGLSKSTVSERIRELVKDGWVIAEPYGQVALTKEGVNTGKKLTFKHRVIEVFLYQTLELPKESVHAEAEQLEHAFSDDVIKKLAKFLGNPQKDPHGSSISEVADWKK